MSNFKSLKSAIIFGFAAAAPTINTRSLPPNVFFTFDLTIFFIKNGKFGKGFSPEAFLYFSGKVLFILFIIFLCTFSKRSGTHNITDG